MSKKADIELLALIDKDEKILWQGHPNKKCFLLNIYWDLIISTIILYFMVMLPLSLMAGPTASTIGYLFFHPMFTLKISYPISLFMIITISYFIIYSFADDLMHFFNYRNMHFVITDQCIYISYGIFSKKFECKPIHTIPWVNTSRDFIERLCKVGSVNFSGITHKICFIHNYKRIYKLIKKLKTTVQ
ncbi:MAG: PH domain-containing protein [Alphaproteobacteria bacterium]|nr:PH domain-containing protein [Alphaproteobacteria bacterium]